MDWLEYWSEFLEWNLGGKFWSETENAILVVKEPVAVLGVFCPVLKRPEKCLKGPDGVIL